MRSTQLSPKGRGRMRTSRNSEAGSFKAKETKVLLIVEFILFLIQGLEPEKQEQNSYRKIVFCIKKIKSSHGILCNKKK